MLRAGKDVIQEKPAAGSISESEAALSLYNFISAQSGQLLKITVLNTFFFFESRKLIYDVGDIMNVQAIVEGSMNSSNPYFSSTWRQNCIAWHVDKNLLSPDNLCNWRMVVLESLSWLYPLHHPRYSGELMGQKERYRSSVGVRLDGIVICFHSSPGLQLRNEEMKT